MSKLRPSNSRQIKTKVMSTYVISAKVISDWGDLKYIIFYHSSMKRIS